MSREILDLFDVAYYAAARLVRTEINRMHNDAALESYRAMGIEEYIYLATLDSRTCAKCGPLDLRRFKVSEAKAGVNLPPIHPNDRCTTMPDMGQGLTGERMARNPVLSKAMYVPADMTYGKWKKQFIENAANDTLARPSAFNSNATFSLNVPVYSAEVNSSVSKACKEAVRRGVTDGKEHLILVDTETGEWAFEETGDSGSVGGERFFKFISNNKERKFSFVHNHPSGNMLSLADTISYFSNDQINSFIASGHNGKIYAAYGEKKPIPSGSAMMEALSHDDEILKDLRISKKEGKIDSIDFQHAAECARARYMLSKYSSYTEVET